MKTQMTKPSMLLLPLRTDRLTWWHGLAAVVMAGLGIWVTRDAWVDIFRYAYHQEEYSHIFLVPIVATVLVVVRRMRFRTCTPSFTLVGPLVAGVGWIISATGFYHGIQSFWHGGSVIVVIGCVLSVVGWKAMFRFFPAFAVLVFLVPVPDRARQWIALPLQEWTALIVQRCFELMAVRTQLHGMSIEINGQATQVAEACNGMRMVFALIMVVYLFAYAMPLRNGVRLLLLLVSPLAALACNVIRVLPTVWLFGNAPGDVALMFHDLAGWAMLPLAFALLYGILKIMRWALIPVENYTLASQAQ